MKDGHEKAISYLSQKDSVIRGLIDQIGSCSLRPSADYFKSLVRSIISQQLSNQAARSIYLKFLKEVDGQLTPQKTIKLKPRSFRIAGISKQKASYLVDLATMLAKDELDLASISKQDDQAIIDALTKVRGIGTWSAKMFLIFCLNRQNVLPYEDVGFRRAIMRNYSLSSPPDDYEIATLAQNWSPYCSIAAWYLWQSIND